MTTISILVIVCFFLVIFSFICSLGVTQKVMKQNTEAMAEISRIIDYYGKNIDTTHWGILRAEDSANVTRYILAADKSPTAVLADLSNLLVDEFPGSEVWFLAAQTYAKLEMVEEGRRHFEKALNLNPKLGIWKTHDPLIRKLYTNN